MTDEPSSPNAIMCSLRMLAPALVPPTVTPAALRLRISWATGVPPSRAVRRSWLPPVKKMPVASSSRCRRFGSWQSRRVSKSITGDARCAELAKQRFVARPGLVHLAGGRDHDDVGILAAGNLDEAAQDAPIVLLVLRAADRDDPAARFAFGNSAWTHVVGCTPRV